jgi:ATP/maltotriose-dependent transcriptional regulator MalT
VIERSSLLVQVPSVGQVQVLSVSAPAGFGKSTFVAQWASRQLAPVAWLSLDAGDNDASRFWSGLMRSLTELVGPDLVQRAGEVVAGSTAFLEAFGDLVDPDGQGIGVVLDDLHLITNERVLSDVERLVAALPASSTIVLSSRTDPPVARARLEAEGRLHTVTADDLRFSPDEIREATGCDDAQAKLLWEVSEGWPVAAITLQRSGVTLPARAPGVIGDYLADEVFAVLDPEVLQIVLEVAHLDAFNADLCEAATGRGDVRVALDWLREQGLFLVDLGSTMGEGWCRLHHLISAVARKRAAYSVDATGLWRRAARWSRENGLDEDALRYAIRARDRGTVAATAGDVLLDSALRGEADTCLHWLGAIDPDDLRDDPRAHGVGVYMATEWMAWNDRAPWLRSRRRHFGGEDDVVLRLVHAIEAMREGRASEAVELSQRVMDECADYAAAHAPDLMPILLGSAFSNQIRARVFQGTTGPDDPVFPSAIALIRPHAPLLAAFVHSYWGLVAIVDGDDVLAASLAEEFYQARRPRELSRPVRRDNSMVGALLASRQTGDPERLTALARGIEDLPAMFEGRGQHTDAALVQLVLASLYGRAGNRERRRHHDRRANVLLRTFEDAPFLSRLRDALQTMDAPGERTPAALAEGLTPRQRTIVAYLATDLSTKEIAEELHISRHTLRTHLRDVYRRLDVRSRHQAVMKVGAEQGGDLEHARTAGR